MPEKKKDMFFKKVITCIKDFEKYPQFATHSFKEVFSYILMLLLIFTLITSIAFTYKVVNSFYETTDEEYTNMMKDYNIEISKEEILQNFEGRDTIVMYIIVYLIVFIYLFVFNILNTFINVLLLAMLGYLATLFMRFRIRFDAMCKISTYALTLSIMLSAIVIFIECFTTFKVAFYEAMYLGIAYIYIIAAISIIRMDIIKNKQELLKIMEEEKRVKEELERQEQEEREKAEEEKEKEEKEEDKQDEEEKDEPKNENKEEGNTDKDEPQGDNA